MQLANHYFQFSWRCKLTEQLSLCHSLPFWNWCDSALGSQSMKRATISVRAWHQEQRLTLQLILCVVYYSISSTYTLRCVIKMRAMANYTIVIRQPTLIVFLEERNVKHTDKESVCHSIHSPNCAVCNELCTSASVPMGSTWTTLLALLAQIVCSAYINCLLCMNSTCTWLPCNITAPNYATNQCFTLNLILYITKN